MCFKKILEKSSEKVADITCLAGDISDLIMVSLIANHKCTSISFDTAEFSDRKIKSIKKYKRKVNRLYKEDFVIQRNNILIKNKNIENVKPFIKERIISAIPPLDFDNNDTEKYFKRYISNESYPNEDNEIKITDAYQKNKLIFMPYLMIWITKFMPVTLQLNLIYSSLFN